MLPPHRDSTIRIAGDVIDPGELLARVAIARSAIASAAQVVMSQARAGVDPAADSLTTLRTTLDELRAHTIYLSTERLRRTPGVRGRIVYEVSRIVRRLTSWYVEPRWLIQQEADEEMTRLLTQLVDAVTQLSDDVDQLAVWRRRIDRPSEGDDSP